jgi:hypothetical protein
MVGTAVPYMVNDDIRWLMIDGLMIAFKHHLPSLIPWQF